LTQASGETPCDINVIYTSLKTTRSTILLLTIWVCLHSFSQCWLANHSKSCEIPREFELIAVHGHPESSMLVSIESEYATSCYSLGPNTNSGVGLSPTVFEILTFKARKLLVFPTPPLFDAPVQEEPVRIF